MSTADLPLKKIGFISKLNGYKGELVLAADGEDFFDAEFLFFFMDGIPVPFAVEDIFEKGGSAIVKLEDVNDEDRARPFLKQEAFVEQKKKKKSKTGTSLPDIKSYTLFDAAYGELGPVIRVDEFPQQLIAVCEVGGREVLIPWSDDFIDSIDEEKRLIMLSLPDGLIDLYLKS